MRVTSPIQPMMPAKATLVDVISVAATFVSARTCLRRSPALAMVPGISLGSESRMSAMTFLWLALKCLRSVKISEITIPIENAVTSASTIMAHTL